MAADEPHDQKENHPFPTENSASELNWQKSWTRESESVSLHMGTILVNKELHVKHCIAAQMAQDWIWSYN